MFETLDSYSIKRLPIDTDTDHLKNDPSPSSDIDHDMLIGIVNSYLMSYASTEYLFKVNRQIGANFIEALKRALPKKRKVVYVAYTNTFKGIHLSRMMQNAWAFPNKTIAKEYTWQMLKEVEDVNNTHIVMLPTRVNEQKDNWREAFIDPYYNFERIDWQQKLIAKEMGSQPKRLVKYQIEPISSEKIREMAKHKATVGETVKAIEFNTRLMEYYKELNRFGGSKGLAEEGQRLRRERKMLDKHLDIPGAITDLLMKK